MRKYFTILSMAIGISAYGQTNTFPASGNVGIGTITPGYLLELKSNNSTSDIIAIKRSDVSPNLDIYSIYSGSDDIQQGSFAYGVRPSDNAWQIWERPVGSGWNNLVSVLSGGNVGIGISNPTEKLSVNGIVKTKEVKVDINGWPDYVFQPEYKLPSLESLSTQIKERGHLPNIPSAEDVSKNGIALGEMNQKLLEKIEELTLYAIKQNEQIKRQNKKSEQQEDLLQKQSEAIELLKKQNVLLKQRIEKLEDEK